MHMNMFTAMLYFSWPPLVTVLVVLPHAYAITVEPS